MRALSRNHQMGTLFYILLIFVFYLIGTVTAAFTILPIVIILRVGIPVTNRLESANLLHKSNHIIRNYLISSILLATVFLLVNSGVLGFIPIMSIPFFIGQLFSLVSGIGKTGCNYDNLKEYFDMQEKHITIEKQQLIELLGVARRKNG